MSIVSAEPRYGKNQANGKRSVKYVFTDHLGDVYISPSKHVALDFDVEADLEIRRSRREDILANSETAQYLDNLDENSTPKHQTKNQLRRNVLIKILKATKLSDVVPHLKSVRFLTKITDNQLKALLSIDDVKVIQIRAWQVEMLTVWQINKSYGAIL
jgi:hypothetical protein